MPVHEWTRVDAGIFHHFHNAWIQELSNALNGGLLPEGYYALTEQHFGRPIADLLALHAPEPASVPLLPPSDGGTAVAEAPPRVRRKLTASAAARNRHKTLAIRHVSGHRLVALVEIVSPANKDRAAHVEELVEKIEQALRHGIHVLLLDLFPPSPHDPSGLNGAVWERFDDEPYDLPAGEPLTLASYVGGPQPDAWVDHGAVGSILPDMPLFPHADWYVNVPLEATYLAGFGDTPAFWRRVLEEAPSHEQS